MKADIVTMKSLADHPAYYMFSGMLLHMVESSVPVYYTMDLCSRFYRLTTVMKYLAFTLMNIKNIYRLGYFRIRAV